jgi:phage shock protein A
VAEAAAWDEEAAGISRKAGDSGAAPARAQNTIASMQAGAGAMDEVLESGVLEDVGRDTDDLQKEFDEAGSTAGVDRNWPG